MKTKLPALLLMFSCLAVVQGQVLIRVQQGNNISPVANGGSVAVNSTGVGQPKNLVVTITYVGTTRLSFAEPPQLLGSQDFSITAPPPPFASLGPNQSLSMELRFLPSSGQLVQTELDYTFTQSAPPPAEGQPAQPGTPGIIVIGLTGIAPDYSLSYASTLDGNILNLPPGGTLDFIDTVVNSATLTSMAVVNRGSGSGQVQSVTTTGDAFSLVSLPLLPSPLPVGANLQFQLRYRPRQAGADTGTMTVTYESGVSHRINLRGRGITSYLTYDLIAPDGASRPIVPNQTVQLASTAVGDSSTVFIRLRNTTTLDITVASIAVAGTAFQISNLPPLPLAMAPGDVQLFSLIFSPTTAGRQTGNLRVGSDTFFLAADGIGPQVSYSYRSPAGLTAVQPLGGVVFPGAQVGGSSTVEFIIRNTGSAPAPIVSVGIVSEGTPVFTLTGLPALPAAIAPAGSISFTIRFSPLNTNLSSASLRINTDAFTLAGIASTPAPLPDFTIQGPTAVQPFQQPAVSLTLASPYTVALTGTITLTTESDNAASDPSVQFSSGGRVATFTIPAGSTSAVFSNGSNQIRYQTGSVAGTIVLTPAFGTEGGLDLTPDNPKQLRASLPTSAPQLVSAGVDSRTANGFTLSLVGFTTTRSLARATVTFKGKPGFNFPKTDFTMDLTASSFLWFSSPASVPFGGQFLMQIPFSVSNSDTSSEALPPIQAIESATVNVTNSVGTSSSLTALVQ